MEQLECTIKSKRCKGVHLTYEERVIIIEDPIYRLFFTDSGAVLTVFV